MSRMLQALKELQARQTPSSCSLTGSDTGPAVAEPAAPHVASETAIEPESGPSLPDDAADNVDVPADSEACAHEQPDDDPPLTERVELLLDGMFVALADEPADHSVLDVQTVTLSLDDESSLAPPPCTVHLPPLQPPTCPEAQRLDNRTAPFATCIARHLERAETASAFTSLADALAADLDHCFAPILLLLGAEADPDMAETAGTLAVALQRHYARILLVDIAGTQGHLTQRFQLAGQSGLAGVLLDRCGWEGELVAVGEGIDVLPAGSEIAGRDVSPARLGELLDRCRAFYDLVVLSGAEASPLTSAIARRCDACYLLVRLGTTDRAAADGVANWLLTHGARLMGCMVTNAKV